MSLAEPQKRPPGRRRGQPARVLLQPYPDIQLLQREMTLRAWSVRDMATAAGIGISTAYRVLAGEPVRAATIETISQALRDHPAQSATAEVLAGRVA